jgi:FAD/FMN-containing dehydrogenase
MAWRESFNMDFGFLLDMRLLDMIDISPNKEMVSLGPGSTWAEIHKALAPHNLSVVGARVNEVGVGGFLLSGELLSMIYPMHSE